MHEASQKVTEVDAALQLEARLDERREARLHETMEARLHDTKEDQWFASQDKHHAVVTELEDSEKGLLNFLITSVALIKINFGLWYEIMTTTTTHYYYYYTITS